jgi:hypothetical protein
MPTRHYQDLLLRFDWLYNDYTTNKHKTYKDEEDRPSKGYPIISIDALQRLLSWYESNCNLRIGEGRWPKQTAENPPPPAENRRGGNLGEDTKINTAKNGQEDDPNRESSPGNHESETGDKR